VSGLENELAIDVEGRAASGHMHVGLRAVLLLLVLGAAGIACGTTGPEACKAAGGTCVVGGTQCIGTVGPQDCNPDRTPAGQYCCLPCPALQTPADGGFPPAGCP